MTATEVLGIRYAEARRWAAPEPIAWNGERGGERPPAPPQPTDGTPGGASLPGLEVGPTSEDCLYLNVWSDTDASGAPVLVWIPGGAFVTGGAAIPLYDGARLAARGAVVVSVTYRVGALGFAAVPGCAPNRGLLDQVAALHWVREHIVAFGGDPTNVTVFGESAGGGSVLHLLAMPSATGLLQRAIVQSGATDSTLSAEQAASVATTFHGALEGDPRTAEVDRILAAQGEALMAGFAEIGAMPFHPYLDGEVIAQRPVDAVATTDVDLLIGTTRDEMRMFLDPRSAELDRERLVRRTARYLASLGGPAEGAPELVARYDDDPHLPSPGDVWSAVQTDGEMRRPMAAMADAHSTGRAVTFAYRFDEPLVGRLAHLRACHAADLPYPFGTVDQWAEVVGPGAPALSEAVQTAWVAFAAGGDPTCPELGSWPAYATATRATMLLSAETSGAVDDPDGQRRQAWADLAPVRSDPRP
ncbi:MAG: carboxylesterase/lipase family protein [Acidimicrobiia bacterium]|nr:carboxylesterase/lipase family protein [Acidimicrobiia bacterium]